MPEWVRDYDDLLYVKLFDRYLDVRILELGRTEDRCDYYKVRSTKYYCYDL